MPWLAIAIGATGVLAVVAGMIISIRSYQLQDAASKPGLRLQAGGAAAVAMAVSVWLLSVGLESGEPIAVLPGVAAGLAGLFLGLIAIRLEVRSR
jgi:hypothetical protein